MARIRIAFKGADTVVPLADGETTIGRSNRCTIHLPDPGLADVHFRIRHRTKGWQLKDDGSGIGTKVNGKPVFATTLRHGDVIEAGHLHCRFLLEAEAPRPPPPPPPRPPEEPPRRREPPRGERVREEKPQAKPATALYVGFGAFAVAALIAVYLLLGGSAEEEAAVLWQEAHRLRDLSEGEEGTREHLEQSAAVLRDIRTTYGRTRIAVTAQGTLAEVEKALDALERIEMERRGLDRAVETGREDEVFTRLARLKIAAHPLVTRAARNVEDDLKLRRVARVEHALRATEEQANAFAAEKQYADALRLWREFDTNDFTYRKRADDALRVLEKRIGTEYRGLLRLAGRGEGLDGRIGLLEANREVFRGTAHAEDLEVRISALRARRNLKTIVVLDQPKKAPKTEEGQPPPEEKPPEEEAGPYEDPPAVADLVKRRRYAEAASMLNDISRHPDAKTRVEELTLLANLMADLAGAVAARPADFTSILLPHGVGRADAVGADAKYLTIRKEGQETRYAWDALPAKSFVRLFRLAGFTKPPRLATAIFFDEEMQPKEAQKAYVAFFRSEQAPTTLTRILARRRGIKVPEGGFEIFRGRIVTEAEKNHVLLLEQIEKLGRQARSTNERRRKEAWTELEKLGEPALETLTLALRGRQGLVADELSKSSAFTPQRFVARLGGELRQAREDALKFILDAQKYPYPNKSDAAQKEAERLVDKVRELYERPYPRLLGKSEAAQALDKELKDLDATLARLDPLSEPAYENVVAEVVRKLDPSMIALDGRDQKRIEYNVSVREYNKKVKTSADAEERGNVEAVNEYRWMMGLHAVKIDERLVRAARKHSIEMRQKDYFAHESPTPKLRSPGQRAKREGYGGGVAENIARGASTGRGAFWQWFKSSGHHRNMLNPGHTDLGCGSFAHHWWTQKFGRASGRNLSEPQVPADPDPAGQSGNGMPAPDDPTRG